MAKTKPAWHAILPGGKTPGAYSLDELRAAKQTHAFLTEKTPGPDGVVYFVRAYRYLLLFGVACVAEDKFPPLTRCWKDLHDLFAGDASFGDGVLVESWILMDFPFGPEGQTVLDYFEQFLADVEGGIELQRFIDEARRSRLGLHQDVMHTKKVAKFRELFTGRVSTALPSIKHYGKGEILLVRTMISGDQVFFFGDPKGFPSARMHRTARSEARRPELRPPHPSATTNQMPSSLTAKASSFTSRHPPVQLPAAHRTPGVSPCWTTLSMGATYPLDSVWSIRWATRPNDAAGRLLRERLRAGRWCATRKSAADHRPGRAGCRASRLPERRARRVGATPCAPPSCESRPHSSSR